MSHIIRSPLGLDRYTTYSIPMPIDMMGTSVSQEVMENILSYLSPKDIGKASRTCLMMTELYRNTVAWGPFLQSQQNISSFLTSWYAEKKNEVVELAIEHNEKDFKEYCKNQSNQEALYYSSTYGSLEFYAQFRAPIKPDGCRVTPLAGVAIEKVADPSDPEIISDIPQFRVLGPNHLQVLYRITHPVSESFLYKCHQVRSDIKYTLLKHVTDCFFLVRKTSSDAVRKIGTRISHIIPGCTPFIEETTHKVAYSISGSKTRVEKYAVDKKNNILQSIFGQPLEAEKGWSVEISSKFTQEDADTIGTMLADVIRLGSENFKSQVTFEEIE